MNIIKYLFFAITDSLVNVVRSPVKENAVLLIRLDGIGDFVLWLDAAKEFRRLYPPDKHRIVLCANSTWAELAKLIPYWDDVWTLNQRRFLCNPIYRFRVLKKVRQSGFDTVIHPTFSRQFFTGDAMIKASGAKEKIGSIGDCSCIEPWQKRLSDRWYTRLIPATPEPLMELKRNSEFMQDLGIKKLRTDLPNLHIRDNNYPVAIKHFYVIFIGAGSKKKMWPIERFARLADRIYEQTGWHGIVCGGPREATIGQRLAGICNATLKNFAGETNLSQLAVLIKKAQFMVSNDTGSVHIAAAVGTPVICILGGGHYGRFLPYQIEKTTIRPLPITVSYKMNCFGCKWKCVHYVKKGGPAPCIDKISMDQVWNEVRAISKDIQNKYVRNESAKYKVRVCQL